MKRKSIFILWFLLIFFALNCGKSEMEFTIWVGGTPQELEFWEELIQDFNKSYNYDLILVRQPTYSDQRRQSLVVSLGSRQPNPDLYLMDVIWIKQFVQSDWLQPLSPYAVQDTFSTNVFFEKILNLVDTYDNTLYALPVFVDAGLLYYRTDLLSREGFSPPSTWQELVYQSERIQKKERVSNASFSGYVWQGAQYEGLVCTFLEFIFSNGGWIIQDGKLSIDNKQNVEALIFMQDLIHRYGVSPQNTYTEMKEEEVRRAFQNGNALFERNWSYACNLHQRAESAVQGKFGISPPPHFAGGQSAAALGGWHVGISEYSDMKEKAWEFVKFITSYDVQKKMALNIGWNPSRKDVYADTELLQTLPHLATLREVFTHSVSRPNLSYYPQISEVIQRYLNNCLAGNVSAEDALTEIQKEVEKIAGLYEEQ